MQIKSNGLRIALFGIAGALVAAASSLAVSDYYVGTAELVVRDANEVSAFTLQVMSRRSLWQIIEKNGLYESDRNRIPNEDITAKLRHAIRITSLQERKASPPAIIVSFYGPDPIKAKAVTEDLAHLFLGDGNSINRLIEISLHPPHIFPNRIRIIFAGLCAGLLAGLAYVRIMNGRRVA